MQPAGEYVVEIVADIVQGLPELAVPGTGSAARYGRFLVENEEFLDLTRQRVASYWNCYYRSHYFIRADYPGFRLLSSLRAAALQHA